METRQLLTWYCRAVERGSFSAAARELDLMPSSLSRAIQQLEASLGVTLLSRSTRRLTMTEAGDIYYQRAREVLEALDAARDAVQQLQDEPRGRLRITAPTRVGQQLLTPLVPAFVARYPRVEFDLVFTDEMLDLAEHKVDVAIRVDDTCPDVPHRVEQLGEYRRLVVASPAYLTRHGIPQHPRDLIHPICLTRRNSSDHTTWRFYFDDAWQTVELGRRHTANQPETLFRLAEAGLGIGRCGNYLVGEALTAGRLVTLLDDFRPPQPHGLYAIYPDRPLPAKTAAFLAFVRERLPRSL